MILNGPDGPLFHESLPSSLPVPLTITRGPACSTIMDVIRGVKTAALLALISSQSTFAAPTTAKFAKRHATELGDAYDYVIVGGGLSGLVVANRLTEDPDGGYPSFWAVWFVVR